MPLELLEYEDFVALVVAEFTTENPDIDPTVDPYSKGYNNGLAAACLSLQSLIRDLEKEAFPQTSTNSDLDKWGGYEDLERNPALGGRGLITLPGTIASTLIPLGKEFAANGFIYSSTAVASINDITEAITSITRSGTLATATTDSNHNLATGQEITIAGAVETEYNGLVTIIVTVLDEFKYTVSGSPSTPATGTITYQSIFASINAQCTTTGQETNLDSGASLSMASPSIAGASSTAIVQFDGLTGGTEVEEDGSYLTRILLSRSLIEGVFTAGQIKLAALGISGNTRVFVIRPDLSTCAGSPTFPTPGQVSVYILRDDDPSITPSQTILDETKEAVIDNGKMPGHTSEADVFVLAPTLIVTDFTFSSLSPDTETMKDAIEANLKAFFEDTVVFGTDVTEASYQAAIQNTQDLITGDFITSFSLSAPSGDITVIQGEIASLGVVTYA